MYMSPTAAAGCTARVFPAPSSTPGGAARLGISPGRFFLDLRLDEARRMVTDTRLPLQEVALALRGERTLGNRTAAFLSGGVYRSAFLRDHDQVGSS